MTLRLSSKVGDQKKEITSRSNRHESLLTESQIQSSFLSLQSKVFNKTPDFATNAWTILKIMCPLNRYRLSYGTMGLATKMGS